MILLYLTDVILNIHTENLHYSVIIRTENLQVTVDISMENLQLICKIAIN